ncbi:MAG: glycoside hydrolase family 78 protein [Planctomycetes bacterium]|nr:glycoside hydrolase family 78 protein [Planctomycetota bacterium]
MSPTRLRCNDDPSPFGIDATDLRFTWAVDGLPAGRQLAGWQVLVASTPALLRPGAADCWDSGRQAGAGPAAYAGRAPSSRARWWWTVRVWDDRGDAGAWAEPAAIEFGLLDQADWRAEWIGFIGDWPGAALGLRGRFRVERPLARATVYVCGLGLHELRLDGAKVGDRVLDPAPTGFDRRVLYVAHDLTARLPVGEHCLAVALGQGWHGAQRLRLQLHLDYADGGSALVATGGEDWRAWQAGPLATGRNGLFFGEDHDATLEPVGWDQPGQVDVAGLPRTARWGHVMQVEAPGGIMQAMACEPCRVVETCDPVAVTTPAAGAQVFDFGVNGAGWARLAVSAPRGTRLVLRFAEILHADGNVNQEPLYASRAADTFVCAGAPGETWEPRFTYHGFRYVQVEGIPEGASVALAARRVRSDAAVRGAFACGVPLLQRIHEMCLRTELANLHGMPTDCPQRAERMGWLNDLSGRADFALANVDLARVWRKWLDDVADTQDESGAVADTAPFRFGYRPACPVVMVPVYLPWLLHRHYGDLATVRRHLGTARRWVEFLDGRCRDDGLLHDSRWSDWAPPTGEPGLIVDPYPSTLPASLVSTAFLAFQWGVLARLAELAGDRALAERARASAAGRRAALHRAHWDEAGGGFGPAQQAADAIPLGLGLVGPEREQRCFARLVASIARAGGRPATGNIATRLMLDTLARHGRNDLAIAMASREDYPSWGFMLAHGATTLWERWEGGSGGNMNSHDHPMLGAVDGWMHHHLAGLRVAEDACAADRLEFAPGLVAGCPWAESSLDTPRGRAALRWERAADGRCRVQWTVPAGATARLQLPAGWRGEAPAGLGAGTGELEGRVV